MKTIARILRRGKVTLLAVVVALTVVGGSTALAGTGVGAPFNLGKTNTVNAISKLVGSVTGPSLRIDNNSTSASATAINLLVEPGNPPMKVNADAGTATNLSADKLDGKDSSEFAEGVGGIAREADNANYLDGKDSTLFMSSKIYKTEGPVNAGAPLGDGTFVAAKECEDPEDVLLSGGPANIDPESTLLESFPTGAIRPSSWKVRINKNNLTDDFNVVVLCADHQ